MNGMSFVILNMIQEAQDLIRTLLAKHDDHRFVMTLSNPQHGVDLIFPGKDISYTDCKKCIIRNMHPSPDTMYLDIITTNKSYTHALNIASIEDMYMVIDQLLHLRFRQWHIQTPQKDLFLKFPKVGKIGKNVLHHYAHASKRQWQEQLEKDMLIYPDNAGLLLQAIGICDDTLTIIPAMRDKYVQINHFIRMYEHYADESSDMHIIDCGCGQAYVSFALLWYLRTIKQVHAVLTGIERNPELIASCIKTAHALSFDDHVHFIEHAIQDAQPQHISNATVIVIALHACDTATDDALALALKMNADIILAAPCCHHYVQEQMDIRHMPPEESFLIRDGIMKERLGDMLTDSMRRDLLISEGYSSDLIEFTPLEHTAKNVMIRAKHIPLMPAQHRKDALIRFQEASKRWHVTPKLYEIIKK